MDFGTEIDGTEDFFQMFWPIIVSHKIGNWLFFSSPRRMELTFCVVRWRVTIMGNIRTRSHFKNAIWDCPHHGGNHTRNGKHNSGENSKICCTADDKNLQHLKFNLQSSTFTFPFYMEFDNFLQKTSGRCRFF